MSIPIYEKSNLTIKEYAEYSNIGEHKLRELVEKANRKYVLRVGNKTLIKRKLFDEFIEKQLEI